MDLTKQEDEDDDENVSSSISMEGELTGKMAKTSSLKVSEIPDRKHSDKPKLRRQGPVKARITRQKVSQSHKGDF